MNKTYIPTLIVLALLAVLHKLASMGHWYVRYPGMDIFMHILGGVGLAFSIFWILHTFFPRYNISFWTILAYTFAAGVLWEAFEALNDIAGAPLGTARYYLDTVKDLASDTLGAIISALFLGKK